MSVLAMSSLVFALVFGGALAGMAVRRVKPDERFVPEAKDSIRLAIGLVVTMTGLVLGMLVSSGKTFYDSEKSQVAEMSSEVIFLSDLLKAYGPETVQLRVEAHDSVEEIVDRIWPKDSAQSFQLKPTSKGADFYEHVELLVPRNAEQAAVKAQLLAAILNLRKTYWFLYLQSEQTSITVPVLWAVTLWLVVIFFSFGVFAPRIQNVFLTFGICAMAVSIAIFIILSMNSPFTGAFRISPAAVHDVLGQIPTGP
ncbi:MAG TPA: hypothetical protein VK814_11855 [Acidobacteriaceae bacterium]|jgi:hypothetical protein|nr:hypothetical protein [Acidobacteriaceae bacterium]